MSFFQSFQLALKNIMSNKVRSLLTMLGIIIGVCAVIVIVGMGNGMKNYLTDSFKSMGTNILTVNIWGTGASSGVKDDDMFKLLDDNAVLLKNLSPVVGVSGTVKIGSKTLEKTSVSGVSETYGEMSKFKLTEGRFLQYIDIYDRKNVCVIGSYIAKELFNGSALGKTVNISGGLYEIVGVLKEESDSKQGGSDDAVYLPYSVASRIAGKNSSTIYFASDDNNITSMQMLTYNFEVVSEGTVTQARMIIENYLMDVYKSRDAFYVRSMAEMLKEMNTMISVLITVLAAIAAISLFVGGIGIMNIMLISVSERTKEIGIRKSLGAKQWHIMCQFVIEAATTSALGGLAGIGFGYLLSMAGTNIIVAMTHEQLKVAPTSSSVLMAFLISAGIGILFGYLPAKKAARLNPIDALRYE